MSVRPAVKPAAMGARFGLYAGLATLGYFIALYQINRQLLISPVILLGFVIIVAFKIVAAYYLWKAQMGGGDFKDALKSVFMVSVVSLAMVVVFLYLLFNFIDTSLTEQMKKNISGKMMKSFEDGNITKEQLDFAEGRTQHFRLGAGAFFTMYSFTLFIGFFYALVFAGITKLIGRDISMHPEIHN